MKRAQVTIFIIVAIVIVGAVILFLIILPKTNDINTTFGEKENPNQYIGKCTGEAIKEAIRTIMPQGGYENPELYTEYGEEKYALLCYTNEYNLKCIPQESFYIKHLEEEITNYIEPKIEECFLELETEYNAKGIITDLGTTTELTINILPGQIRADIKKEFSFEDKGETNTYSEYKTQTQTNLYKVAETTKTIISHETQYCRFDQNDYMQFNPELTITKKRGREETTIYTIEDSITRIKSNFAIRGCVLRI